MDHGYKQSAFLSLTEADKQELLSNAQLKDEKTLQDAGVRNLHLRLTEQQHSAHRIQGELLELKKQVRNRIPELKYNSTHTPPMCMFLIKFTLLYFIFFYFITLHYRRITFGPHWGSYLKALTTPHIRQSE